MKEEKTEISARIAEVIVHLNENANSFAKKLGYSRAQTIYDILNGKSAPSYDFFSKFANSEFSELIDLSWLLTGKGLMAKTKRNTEECNRTQVHPQPVNIESEDNKKESKIQDVSSTLIKHLLSRITEQAEEIGRLKEHIKQLEHAKSNAASDAIDTMVANAD